MLNVTVTYEISTQNEIVRGFYEISRYLQKLLVCLLHMQIQ